jgi:glycerol-3-phosphate dehydrogenase (NAD(P)+)
MNRNKALKQIDNIKKSGIGVIGAGSWGTAIAYLLAKNGFRTILWSYEKETVDEINKFHTNKQFLKEAVLPHNIYATNDMGDIAECEILVNVVPTQHIRSVYTNAGFSLKKKYLINCSKGVEITTGKRISQIFIDDFALPYRNYAILSGPSHGEEVIKDMPTTVLAASRDKYLGIFTQEIFGGEFFRVYRAYDVIGAELGSSIKNIIAIASGIVDGLGMGDNTKAALVTRGLAEMKRFGMYQGAKRMTFSGLSGLGDLYVTCSSQHSRNRSVGLAIGRGEGLQNYLANTKMIAEGVPTTKAIYSLAQKCNVEVPIIEKVHQVLYDNLDCREGIHDLMARTPVQEWWWSKYQKKKSYFGEGA